MCLCYSILLCFTMNLKGHLWARPGNLCGGWELLSHNVFCAISGHIWRYHGCPQGPFDRLFICFLYNVGVAFCVVMDAPGARLIILLHTLFCTMLGPLLALRWMPPGYFCLISHMLFECVLDRVLALRWIPPGHV